jgi:hypothetical protein
MTERLVPHDNVVVRRLDDSVVLVNLDTNRIFTLNRTGGRVWELLAEHSSAAEVEAALSQEFAAPAEVIHQEVADLLGELRRERLVIEAPDPG